MNLNNEIDAVQAINRGNIEVFEMLYDKYFTRVKNYSYRIINDESASVDLAQESFIKLWENRSKIDQSPISYLFKVAYNLSMNNVEHKKIVERYEKILGDDFYKDHIVQLPEAEQILISKDIELLLNNALSKLPERCRIIFKMRRINNLKNKEVAKILGISEKSVENQMTIAINKLSRDLKEVLDNRIFFFIFFGG